MTDHEELLRTWAVELALKERGLDAEHEKLRAWMVGKYGEDAVKRFETKDKKRIDIPGQVE